MAKEMTVKEIIDALGYEVKIVKESEKYIFKANDVCTIKALDGNIYYRVIVKIGKELCSLDVTDGVVFSSNTASNQKRFEENNYKKVGVLSDFIK